MPTTFANSINNNLIYADRAEHDAAGNDIATTYATKQEIPSVPVTDVEVDGVSVVSSGVASITMPTFTQAQANWNESDTSAASYIQNKPSIPSATSDLTNDSGFITLSDVPAQVNADWNSSSGASEILNKPSLATVATSGDYDDLTNKPTIPAAQVQSDWTEADNTDPSYIQNKPTLATVATSGQYSDLSGTPTINNVPAVTSSDDNKVLKASYTGGVGSYSWENESTEVPSYTTSEDGKVLGVVDNQGTAELQWVTGGGSSTSDVYVMDGTEPFNDIWNKYQAGTVIYYWTTKPNSSSIYEPYLVTFIRSNDSTHTSGTITYTCLDRQSSSLLFNLYSGVSNGYASGFGVVSKNTTQLTLGGSNGQTLVFNSYGHLAPATINQVPAYTTSEDGKVLGVVDNSGTASLEWVTPAAGGVTDVEVDGVSVVSQGVASITMPTVDQTYNSSSTNAQSGTAVAGAIAGIDEVPAVTSSDDGKVLKATYSGGSGSYAWGADSDTTYTAGNMIAIDPNNSNAIGVSTTAGITDIQQVNALPANPVSTVLYLIPES